MKPSRVKVTGESMKTPEEYLRTYYERNPDLPIEVWIKFCMEEYANQQAIAFARWVNKKGYDIIPNNHQYWSLVNTDYIFIDEELLRMYKEETK